jgi:hypothetical protein
MRMKAMDDTADEIDCADKEIFACAFTDEQLEAAADPTRPEVWTLPSAMYSTACCESGPPEPAAVGYQKTP